MDNQLLRQAITDSGTTQKDVALACAVTAAVLRRWLEAKDTPTADQLRRLTQCLDATPAQLGYRLVHQPAVVLLPEATAGP